MKFGCITFGFVVIVCVSLFYCLNLGLVCLRQCQQYAYADVLCPRLALLANSDYFVVLQAEETIQHKDPYEPDYEAEEEALQQIRRRFPRSTGFNSVTGTYKFTKSPLKRRKVKGKRQERNTYVWSERWKVQGKRQKRNTYAFSERRKMSASAPLQLDDSFDSEDEHQLKSKQPQKGTTLAELFKRPRVSANPALANPLAAKSPAATPSPANLPAGATPSNRDDLNL